MTIIEGKCRLYRAGAHCHTCLTDERWRKGRGIEACPHGVTLDTIPALPPIGGPGTELKAILAGYGIQPGNCRCNAMAAQMDAWGPDGCEIPDNFERIVATLLANAQERAWLNLLPFKTLGARHLVEMAITRARTSANH